MNRELQDLAWSVLPKEFRGEVKRLYTKFLNEEDPSDFSYGYLGLLIKLFGHHNLTSDTEPEEMLTVSRKRVVKIFVGQTEVQKCTPLETIIHYEATAKTELLYTLFGSKCLPDEVGNEVNFTTKEPKPFKYSVGQKVILHFYGGEVSTITEVFRDGWKRKYKVKALPNHVWNENELDPYEESKPAEPKFKVGDTASYVCSPTLKHKCTVTKVMQNEHSGKWEYNVLFEWGKPGKWIPESNLEPYTEPKKEAEDMTIEEINKAIIGLQPNEGQVSDGYHTFEELYDFRRAYNAALVNTHAYPCVKSHRHSDGELCFGGGWFVVQMQLPTGQVSNHYEDKYWDDFDCKERECADPWDGHTDKDVLKRLRECRILKNRDKQFDTILKDSSRGHNRLHIAAMAMQGILNNIDLFKKVLETGMGTLDGDGISYRAVAKTSFLFADALIKEAEKGGMK